MNYIKLNNGLKIPQLGLGVYQIPEGEQTVNAVKWALQAGYRHIDTAAIYGNEKSVGKGIKASGVERREIFLTTKLWKADIRNGRVIQAFEESLNALGTDYIDLYLIHWPVKGFEKAWSELEELHEAGKIKSIGVSNCHRKHLEKLEKTAKVLPAVNQIEAHPYLNNQELIDYCQKKGIAVEVWSPLGGTGGNLLQDETISGLARKYRKTPAQIILRWDVQRNVVVIPKSAHLDRILSNQEIFDFQLSDGDMEVINQLNRNLRVGPNPDEL